MTIAAAATASSAPDWSAIDHDLLCPLCDYNLRGLAEPRCPECGHAFNWREMQEEKLREHPYLFEHHPRENVRSFLRTFFASLRPGKFWTALQPIHRPKPKRLLMYYLLATVLCLMLSTPALLTPALNDYVLNRARRGEFIQFARDNPDWVTTNFGSTQAFTSALSNSTAFSKNFQNARIRYWMHHAGYPILLMILGGIL